MIFKIKPLSDHICFVYGFEKNDRVYDLVLTLEVNENYSEVHALISRVTLTPADLLRMWKALRNASKSELFKFEVLPEHAKAYKLGFEAVQSERTQTFDGFESEILYINRNAKVRAVFSKLAERIDNNEVSIKE